MAPHETKIAQKSISCSFTCEPIDAGSAGPCKASQRNQSAQMLGANLPEYYKTPSGSLWLILDARLSIFIFQGENNPDSFSNSSLLS